jgi:WD40 repeat protein
VWGLAFSPNGQQLVSAAADGTVRLWAVATGTMTRLVLQQPFEPAHALSTVLGDGTHHTILEQLYSVAFSPDGQLLAVGTDQGRVILVELATGEVLHAFQGHEDIPYSRDVIRIVFSSDAQFVASKGQLGGIYLWNIPQRRLVHAFISPNKSTLINIYSMTFSPDSTNLILVNETTGLPDSWLLPDGPFQPASQPDSSEIMEFSGDARGVSATISADTRLVAIGGGLITQSDFEGIPFLGPLNDPRIFVWHAGAVQPAFVLKGHQDNVIGMAFSPDNELLASVSWDRTLRLWRIAD